MFLFLHSQEGKKCFHDCAKIILRIAGIFSAIQNKSSRAIVFTLSVFQHASRAAHKRFAQQTCPLPAASVQARHNRQRLKRSPSHAASRRWGAKRGLLGSVVGYELRSICARNSAIEPNLTVPSGSLASIDPSV